MPSKTMLLPCLPQYPVASALPASFSIYEIDFWLNFSNLGCIWVSPLQNPASVFRDNSTHDISSTFILYPPRKTQPVASTSPSRKFRSRAMRDHTHGLPLSNLAQDEFCSNTMALRSIRTSPMVNHTAFYTQSSFSPLRALQALSLAYPF